MNEDEAVKTAHTDSPATTEVGELSKEELTRREFLKRVGTKALLLSPMTLALLLPSEDVYASIGSNPCGGYCHRDLHSIPDQEMPGERKANSADTSLFDLVQDLRKE
jgi:hypothetical protein